MKSKENVIEWITGQNMITCTISQAPFKTKLKKLAEKHSEVQIIAENKDGSILVKIPISYLRFNAPRELSEEQKQALAERMRNMRKNDR